MDLILTGVSGEASEASAILDSRSFRVCVDEADGGAASAGLVDVISKGLVAWVAVVAGQRGVADKETAVVPHLIHMAGNTSIEASGRVAVRRSAVHADRAAVIEQKLANLTVGCGMKWAESLICSLLRRP